MKKLIVFLFFLFSLTVSQAQSVNGIPGMPVRFLHQPGRFVTGNCKTVIAPRIHRYPGIRHHWKMRAVRHGRYS